MTKETMTVVTLWHSRDVAQGEDDYEHLHLCLQHVRVLLALLLPSGREEQKDLIGKIGSGRIPAPTA